MSTYPLRIADHVMEEAKRAAAEDNVSLNQLFSAFIADGLGHRRAIMNLKNRAIGGMSMLLWPFSIVCRKHLPMWAMSGSRIRKYRAAIRCVHNPAKLVRRRRFSFAGMRGGWKGA